MEEAVVAPLPIIRPQKSEIVLSLEIKQNEEKYIFKIIKEEDRIILNISKLGKLPYKNYIKKLNLREIKEIHKIFFMINSPDEFIDYIKASFENKKLDIKEDNQKIFLIINIEYLFKSEIIEISLLEQKPNLNEFTEEIFKEISLMKEKIKKLETNLIKNNEDDSKLLLEKQNKEIIDLKEENKKLKDDFSVLKEENKNLKEEIKNIIEKQNSQNHALKEEIKNIIKINEGLKEDIQELKKSNERQNKIKINEDVKIDIQEIKETNKKQNINVNSYEEINVDSVIMKNEEFWMIKDAVEKRINKKIKGLKKLYRATIDGGEVAEFHSKCDNIPNTLTIIKSKGNRRFGGFTSETWESRLTFKDDKNAFLFSLDKNKIYSYKNDGMAIFCCCLFGPSFGHNNKNFNTIGISGNPILKKDLFTYECDSNTYNFDGDNNALSEDGKGNRIFAEEYEVFQIIFP